MHFKDLTPRLNFLKESAGSLGSASPSTAAYLMTVHNGIFHEESKPLNQRQHETFCGGCGILRNPKWTKSLRVKKPNQKRTTSPGANPVTRDGVMVYQCLRCRRRTVTPARKEAARPHITPKPTDPTTANSNPLAASSTTMAVPDRTASKTAENASSKKRAKARKQGGLQALLASKQSRASASPSLDLLDFLQQ